MLHCAERVSVYDWVEDFFTLHSKRCNCLMRLSEFMYSEMLFLVLLRWPWRYILQLVKYYALNKRKKGNVSTSRGNTKLQNHWIFRSIKCNLQSIDQSSICLRLCPILWMRQKNGLSPLLHRYCWTAVSSVLGLVSSS